MRFSVFYGAALVLLVAGLRELLTGSEENRCSMTYMYEYPEYRRVTLSRRVSRLYPAYGLYLYGEGLYAQETRALKLSGAPVLFLPGNAGSYKQARSLGSVALRKAESLDGGVHLNVFTVDFNEELVALYGGSLRKQTLFLHECIKAVLRLYKGQERPPRSVVLVGHSMGGVVARALFTLPRFSPPLVSLILTQASPHLAPVLALDTHLLDFYSAVRERWVRHADSLANVTVLSVGGGYRDYQVRSGLTTLPCSPGDPNKLSLVATAVPRTWVSTDHLSIVWCKELVLATVRAFFDLIDPETNQFTDSVVRRMEVLHHHFIRHPVRMLEETPEAPLPLPDSPEAWNEVNALRLAYSAPKEGQAKYFLFALSSRRKAYSHFYCRSNNMEMSSWVYGCVQKTGSMCVRAVDLSRGTELLPPYKVTAAEVTQVYHTVRHNLSYNSADCAHKLNQKIFPDSKIVKKMSIGRTKAEAVVKDVLAPKAVADVLKALTSDKPLPFSIQTDASNKGNRKMFPLAVQYFSPECGVTNKMLDLIENADESAAGIVALIEQALDKCGLSFDQVTAFSADNTNVNYGIHNSVFTNLKKKQKDLLQGNCHAHIVHNTVKHALDQLTVDVENVVLKVYAFFSTSAKRRESLKEFCRFCDVEFQEILRHVTTRWLSLNPAITRLMQTWIALKSYFISLGEECPKQLRALLKLSEDSTEEDGDIVEVYLLFCNNILSLFEEVVKKLESDETTCVELYSIMDIFKQKLTQRRDDQFYGYLTKLKLQRLRPRDADMARADFTAFLNTALPYVEKLFNFSEDNWLSSLQPLCTMAP